MSSFVIPRIDTDFLHCWLKINDVNIERLKLVKWRKSQRVTSKDIISQVESEFKTYKLSRKTLSEYFNRSVIHFRKSHKNDAGRILSKENCDLKYTTKVTKVEKERVILTKETTNYKYGVGLSQLTSTQPIQMAFEHILSIYKIYSKYENPLDLDVENEYPVAIDFYRVKKRSVNKQIRAFRDSELPGSSIEDVQHILVGVDYEENYYWIPSDDLVSEERICKKSKLCNYKTTREYNSQRNENVCSDESEIRSKQIVYGKKICYLKRLIENGYLSPDYSNYRQKYMSSFDIETFETPNYEDLGAMSPEAFLRPVSIAMASNLPNSEDEFFCKSGDKPEDTQVMVNKWLDHLFLLAEKYVEHHVPDGILKAIRDLEKKLEFEKFSKAKTAERAMLNHLNAYKRFSCFGFNSAKFDLPCMIGLIFQYCKTSNIQVSTIKKGTTYMVLNMKREDGIEVVMKDVRNYTAPCSLDKFLKQWNTVSEKSIFPYQKFKLMSELEKQTTFPERSDFYNELKQVRFYIFIC